MGDPVLREKCRPVKHISPNIHKLLNNMADTMYEAKGVGLAAPQIGVPKRVVVIDVGDGLIELINPEIVSCEGKETDFEGCLSIPGLNGEVERAARVTVRGYDRKGKKVEHSGEGLLARAFQHEIDHLEGILFVDKASRVEKIK
ncbi:peptide deformylase [bacterium]|nr:MAG: peptide deformylase [bacterium]